MKIRAGYVSNSSSSSFCIVGIAVYSGELGELFDLKEEYDDYHYYDFVKENLKGMDSHRGIEEYSSDSVIIGKHIYAMNDDETLGNFKEGIFEQLKKAGYKGSLEDIKIYVDGGYEG